MMSYLRMRVVVAMSAGVIFQALVHAQDAPSVRKGTAEIGGFAGASYGLDEFRIMGGGNISYGVTKWLLPYGEFSYFPGIARERSFTSGAITQTLRYSVPLYDIHGGFHLRVPLKESPVVPYGVFGVGMIRSNFSGSADITIGGVRQPYPITDKSSDVAVNFGGGLRYYVNEKFGIRVEAKVYRPVTGLFDNYFGKVEAGFFYQIH